MNLQALESKPIYLMPVNVISLSLCVILQAEGYDIRGIWDNNKKAHGKQFRGVAISAPLNIEEGTVVVTSHPSFKGIKTQLEDLGIHCIFSHDDILSSSDSTLLSQAFCGVQKQELNNIAPVYSDLSNVSDLKILQSLLPRALIEKENKNIISNLDLFITTRCSLKCKDCTYKTAYFENPADIPTVDIYSGLQELLNCVDYIRNVSILGGEPLLHGDLTDITDFVCAHEKIATVTVITNGTLLPDAKLYEILASKNNLLVMISDYDKLSRNKDRLIQKLMEYEIPYTLQNQMTWYEHGMFVTPHSRTPAEIKKVYRVCNRNCSSLAGKLFAKCQVAIAFELLKAIPPEFDALEKSVVDLSKSPSSETIRQYLTSDEPIGACYICSGKSRTGSKQIPPAIQTKERLPYKKYD